ncbi:MAG TPA: tRNA lysidine(34) synthetase TilS [Acetobacteraceae bacterium]|nr:tRNA lysidine(34) synthetase TilS [Acetobacteraceae bacterium]
MRGWPEPALCQAEFGALMAPLGPFGPSPRLAAGVSGGPHSLALGLLAADWARRRGGDLLALIVDHGLRPESGSEAEGVVAALAQRGIAGQMLRLGLQPGAGLQERARAGRLAAMLGACAETGRPWLLLGHHRADQAETVLFRALRGSGPAGLAAMAPARAEASALLLRPLLGVAPARLAAVVTASGILPVRDPTNTDVRFARTGLRSTLADPAGTGPAVSALAEAASAFRGRRAKAEAALASRLAAAARLHGEGFAEIDAKALGDDGIADAAMAALLRAVGGAERPPSTEAARRLRLRGDGTLSGAWLRRRGGGGGWRLLREPGATVGPAVPARPGILWDRRFRMTGPGASDCTVSALRAPPPDVRAAAHGLPATVLATFPAIRRNGALVAVPALLYPDPETCARFALVFAPAGGPVSG